MVPWLIPLAMVPLVCELFPDSVYSGFSLKWCIILASFELLERPNDHFGEQSFWRDSFSKSRQSFWWVVREMLNFSGMLHARVVWMFTVLSPIVYAFEFCASKLRNEQKPATQCNTRTLRRIYGFRTNLAVVPQLISEVLLCRSLFKLQPQTWRVVVTGNWVLTIQRTQNTSSIHWIILRFYH